jgi:hypothetical protein
MPAIPSTNRAGDRLADRLRRVVNVRQEEVAALSCAFLYLFSLLYKNVVTEHSTSYPTLSKELLIFASWFSNACRKFHTTSC